MGRILAIDVGQKRVGLAITDELQMFASPYGCIAREGSVSEISVIIKNENISSIVIGMPYLPSGGLGGQASDVELFVTELKSKVSLPLDFEDEVLTSVEAEDRLTKMGSKYVKGDIDAMAATIVLESFLSRR